MARRGPSVLQQVLANTGTLPVVKAVDGERIQTGKIYVAIPDHHLVVEPGRLRLTTGPTQHRHRPSIDVLFRSAALAYGPRVIGVVLTGVLDDGTAGLLAIKHHGGVAVVQDPEDAMFAAMPRSALANVTIDHCVPLTKIARLLVRLTSEGVAPVRLVHDRLELEKNADAGDFEAMNKIGKPSTYSCPECHGVLWEVEEPALPRFRCRVGHGYSPQSLAAVQDEAVEDALWAAVRSLEEKAGLSWRLADHWRSLGADQLASEMEQRAHRSRAHALHVRALLTGAEQDVSSA
jgi:two-component system chemotaxis response regulator CheB